jgi:hypothetical protein
LLQANLLSNSPSTIHVPNSVIESIGQRSESQSTERLCNLEEGRIRVYIPYGEPKYSYFFDLKFDQKNLQQKADSVLKNVLERLKMPYDLKKYRSRSGSRSRMVDPTQYSFLVRVTQGNYSIDT